VHLVFSNYDSPANPSYGGGGAIAIHEVARRLARNHVVEVVTGAARGVGPGQVDQVTYCPIGLAAAGPRLGQLLFHLSLPRQLRRRRFDVWCESLTPPFSTTCLPLFTRRPVVALTQVLAGEAMRRKYHLPFDRLERAGLKRYRQAIATSAFLRARLLAANPRLEVAIIPNGVPGDWMLREPEPTRRHLLFLGRLDVEQKGLDLLFDALALVASQLPLPLVVAGAGPPAQEAFVRRRVQELGLGSQVQVVGKVLGEAKHALLREAAFLVMPSRFEASPLVLLEAACYRLPTVCFRIPELSDVPESLAVKVPAFNAPALGAAILALASDPARREALGLAAKRYVRDFDWDLIAARYERFFQQVLSGHAQEIRVGPRRLP
jgi:glycosyltransferase involved in cell wall biosynthesis